MVCDFRCFFFICSMGRKCCQGEENYQYLEWKHALGWIPPITSLISNTHTDCIPKFSFPGIWLQRKVKLIEMKLDVSARLLQNLGFSALRFPLNNGKRDTDSKWKKKLLISTPERCRSYNVKVMYSYIQLIEFEWIFLATRFESILDPQIG